MNLVDYEYAVEYFSHRNNTETWDAAAVPTRENALRMASNLILYGVDWAPGTFRTDRDGETVYDDRIRDAVCEQALYMLTLDPLSIPKALTKGVGSASAGPASVTFDRRFVAPLLLPYAELLIGELGTARTDPDGIENAMTEIGA